MTPGRRHVPSRRFHPRVAVLRVCALVWAACSLAVIWLVWAAGEAEERTSYDAAYAGPSEDEVEFWLALAFSLGAAALMTGTGVVAGGAARRRAGHRRAVRPNPSPQAGAPGPGTARVPG